MIKTSKSGQQNLENSGKKEKIGVFSSLFLTFSDFSGLEGDPSFETLISEKATSSGSLIHTVSQESLLCAMSFGQESASPKQPHARNREVDLIPGSSTLRNLKTSNKSESRRQPVPLTAFPENK